MRFSEEPAFEGIGRSTLWRVEIRAPRGAWSIIFRGQSLARRKLLPEYEALIEAGVLAEGSDSTQVISEDHFLP